MDCFKWIECGTKRLPHYISKIGPIDMFCNNNVYGKWICSIYFGRKWVADSYARKSLSRAKKDGERLAVEYLLGNGFIVLKILKKMNLLEDILSEVRGD